MVLLQPKAEPTSPKGWFTPPLRVRVISYRDLSILISFRFRNLGIVSGGLLEICEMIQALRSLILYRFNFVRFFALILSSRSFTFRFDHIIGLDDIDFCEGKSLNRSVK